MARPTIVAIDDDVPVLNAVTRDLRQRYGREYRVVAANSGAEALIVLEELKQRGEAVALLVADQRMPEMTGVELIEQGQRYFPEARKVLLTAYADIDAAISAINRVGLDYYLSKPWDPPEDHLYPVLDSLLEDWTSNVRLPFEGVRIVGSMWSPAAHVAKDFMGRSAIPYRWLDLERDEEAQTLLAAGHLDETQTPALFFPDGDVLVQPTAAEIAAKVGLSTRAGQPFYDVVIIGGGPAGLSSAVYASADGLRVLLVERNAPGGQAGNSPKIENFLGFPSGISGGDLTRRAVTQARRFGAEILTAQTVSRLRAEGNTRIVTFADGSEVAAKIVLISTGAWFRLLELPGIERWNGAGVYYGSAHIEAANYQDRDVVVIGGANSAAQGLLFLARFARSVTVIIRGAEPTWSRYLDVAIKAEPKITLRFNSQLVSVDGDDRIESVRVQTGDAADTETLPAAAVFVFIGQKPQSDFLPPEIVTAEGGYIQTGLDLVRDGKLPKGWPLEREPMMLETSMPGVFAAGDVRNGTKHGVAAASGDGNAAVSLFWQYLSTI